MTFTASDAIEAMTKAIYTTKHAQAPLPETPRKERDPAPFEHLMALCREEAEAAFTALLELGPSEHVVKFTKDGWTMQHPLSERLDGSLFDCPWNDRLIALNGPPEGLGMYEVQWDDGHQVTFSRVPEEETQ